MGKKYYEKCVVNNTMLIINDKDKLKYAVERGKTKENFLPEELSAMILKALKSYTKDYLEEDVVKAVITVPTYFNDLQREATIAAGKIAGFNELKLLNESVAAAVAYGIQHKLSNNKIIFVFDFGGGTFDVSILKYFNNEFDVLAIDGDLHLGGDNITNIIFEYILSQISNSDLTNDNRFRFRLLRLCEKAKIMLSTQDLYFFDIPEYNEDVQICTETFIRLTNNLFDNVMLIVKRCLENALLSIDHIYEIVLVGGSSRIPAIQDRLTKFFNKKPKKNINPDEVVAQGAAIMAANWNKTGFMQLKLNTMIAHSIGIEIFGKDMSIIIPKYSKLPIQKCSGELRPQHFFQRDVTLNIFSGEDELTKNNIYLGKLKIENIAIEPRSLIRKFIATLEITEDGVLKVSTIDDSKKTDETTIVLDKINLSEVEVKKSLIKLNSEQMK